MSYDDWCVHFRGIQHETCKADIKWRELTGGDDFGIAKRMPCIKSNGSAVVCDRCHYPTPAEVATHEAELEAHMARSAEDMALIGAAHTDGPTSLVYVCQLCDRAARVVETDAAAIIAHLSDAHGLDEATIRAAKGPMSAHMDATAWHQTDYAFTLPDGREMLIKSVRMRRSKADRAQWEDSAPRGKKRR
jgi:hypothetical protein